jgi:hypothetical protein
MATNKITALLSAMEKLMSLAQSETELLKKREYKKAATLLSEKQKLASEYEQQSAYLRGDPELFRNLDSSAVDRLKTVAGQFHQTLDTNMKTLAAAREAGDRLVNAIRNAVIEEEGRDRGYGNLIAQTKTVKSSLNERPITLKINGEF